VATDGITSLIKSLDHLHGKWVRRECYRIVNGVCFPLSFRIFIERGESCNVVAPLHLIHNPLGHNIVVRQFISGNTFEIRYVEDRLVRHDGRGGVSDRLLLHQNRHSDHIMGPLVIESRISTKRVDT
jgi:hypothetical protein